MATIFGPNPVIGSTRGKTPLPAPALQRWAWVAGTAVMEALVFMVVAVLLVVAGEMMARKRRRRLISDKAEAPDEEERGSRRVARRRRRPPRKKRRLLIAEDEHTEIPLRSWRSRMMNVQALLRPLVPPCERRMTLRHAEDGGAGDPDSVEQLLLRPHGLKGCHADILAVFARMVGDKPLKVPERFRVRRASESNDGERPRTTDKEGSGDSNADKGDAAVELWKRATQELRGRVGLMEPAGMSGRIENAKAACIPMTKTQLHWLDKSIKLALSQVASPEGEPALNSDVFNALVEGTVFSGSKDAVSRAFGTKGPIFFVQFLTASVVAAVGPDTSVTCLDESGRQHTTTLQHAASQSTSYLVLSEVEVDTAAPRLSRTANSPVLLQCTEDMGLLPVRVVVQFNPALRTYRRVKKGVTYSQSKYGEDWDGHTKQLSPPQPRALLVAVPGCQLQLVQLGVAAWIALNFSLDVFGRLSFKKGLVCASAFDASKLTSLEKWSEDAYCDVDSWGNANFGTFSNGAMPLFAAVKDFAGAIVVAGADNETLGQRAIESAVAFVKLQMTQPFTEGMSADPKAVATMRLAQALQMCQGAGMFPICALLSSTATPPQQVGSATMHLIAPSFLRGSSLLHKRQYMDLGPKEKSVAEAFAALARHAGCGFGGLVSPHEVVRVFPGGATSEQATQTTSFGNEQLGVGHTAEKAEATVMMEWACRSCTLLNDNRLDTCAVCAGPRSSSAGGGPATLALSHVHDQDLAQALQLSREAYVAAGKVTYPLLKGLGTPTKVGGLCNLGNSCFAAATLQPLLRQNNFRAALALDMQDLIRVQVSRRGRVLFEDEQEQDRESWARRQVPAWAAMCDLAKLFDGGAEPGADGARGALEVLSRALDAAGLDLIASGRQHDTYEFFQRLVDYLGNTERTGAGKAVAQLFVWPGLKQEIRCVQAGGRGCPNPKPYSERRVSITLPLTPDPTAPLAPLKLQRLLQECCIFAPIDGRRQCAACGPRACEGRMQPPIELPPLVVIHLNRQAYSLRPKASARGLE